MKISMKFKFVTLISILLVNSVLSWDNSRMDPELYEPVRENLIDSYLPKAKGEHLSVGNFHPMKFYVDYTRIAFIKNRSSRAWETLTKNLIPTLTEHVSSTYWVPETPNI